MGSFVNHVLTPAFHLCYGHKYQIDHFENRTNKNMNNITSIDFAKRDWTDDRDFILPRSG